MRRMSSDVGRIVSSFLLLSTFSTDLVDSKLYKMLLDTALLSKKARKDVIKRILSFVAVSLRPLNLSKLSAACQLHQDQGEEERIQFMREEIASCRLMVIIQDDKVLLLHQSVKDFLVGPSADHFINEFEAHASLAHRCVDRLIQDFCLNEERDGFLSYATQFWVNHAHMAQSNFRVDDCQAEFFRIDSRCREHWLERLRSGRYFYVPHRFSIFHVASRWGIPALVDYVYSRGHCNDRFSPFIDLEWCNSEGVTPLEEAAKSGHAHVISCLLDHEASEMKVSEPVVKAAARNDDRNGVEVMALLLDRRGNQVTITEEVVKAAAGNDWSGVVMELLLDRRGNQVTITEEVVKAAAGNDESGVEVMELMLDRRGNQVTITEEVVKAAVGNSGSGREVMALLLDRRGDQVTITEEVVEAAARNSRSGREVMALLLDRRGNQVTITEEVVKAAARNYGNGKEVMALLFDRRGDQVTITEEVMKAAAGNDISGKEMMALLLDRRGNKITITEEVVKVIKSAMMDTPLSWMPTLLAHSLNLNIAASNRATAARGRWPKSL